ncbi:MAG: ABC transporter substrate-binding protein [Lachnospiraceae bacterium]|jgi:oligopeptide transport system substrate-binding protein
MKKKKAMAVLLTAATAVTLLAGCGDASSAPTASSTAATASTEASTATAADTTAADTAATDTASADGDVIEDWVKNVGLTASSTNEAAPDWSHYDELVSEIYTDTDLADREAKLHEAEDMLMATGAVLPIYYYNDLYLEHTEWSGDYATVFGTKYFMYAKKDGKNADVMRINLASEPDHLDPALNSAVDGACLASNSFVGLYTNDKDGNIVPALADGDPEVSEDGTEYTVHMKKDLKWSDGSDLNANDIVYSWKRAADPATASDYSYLFTVFDGYGDGTNPDLSVDAPDDYTVHFKLTAPCPYIMSLLAFPVFMPVKQSEVEAADPDGTNPGAWAMEAGFVTDGAYTLTSWNHNESMVYKKNPYFYDADNVSVDELDFMLSAEDTSIYSAFTSGDLDYADTVPNDEVANLKNTPEFHVIDNLGTYYVCFNVNSDMFSGKTVDQAAAMRRAIGLLIDRQYIVDTVGQTDQKVATSFIPAGMSDGHGGEFKTNDDAYTFPVDDGYYQDISVNADDQQQAIALLEYAGYKFDDSGMLSSDTPLKINYLTNEGTAHEAIAQLIQQDLAQVGIDMEISVEDWQTFLNDRKNGNFDVAREGWLADYDDPINMIEMFQSSSGNNDAQLGK